MMVITKYICEVCGKDGNNLAAMLDHEIKPVKRHPYQHKGLYRFFDPEEDSTSLLVGIVMDNPADEMHVQSCKLRIVEIRQFYGSEGMTGTHEGISFAKPLDPFQDHTRISELSDDEYQAAIKMLNGLGDISEETGHARGVLKPM